MNNSATLTQSFWPERLRPLDPAKVVDDLELKIEKLIPGGQALATMPDGKKVMLWGALPGETVRKIYLTANKSHYLEALALSVDQLSSARITPRDQYPFGTSPWQIMTYEYELQQKSQLLQEIFRQHGLEIPNVSVATDGQDFAYRNKMEYALFYDHGDQLIHLAFRARGSHQKIPIQTSSLERPAILARAQQIVADLNRQHADARSYQSLLLRSSQDDQVSGGLYENHRPHPQFPHLTDQILGRTYSYSPNGFFQINLPVYELALRAMQPWVQTDSVLDLYAGVGTIGLSIARDRKLTLVECDRSAYRELEHNCQGTTAQPVLAKSEDALDYIQPGQTVILDPPRAGCRSELLDKLLTTEVPTIIYLSCNPATQARDVKILSSKYQIAEVQPFNFFPRTPHLENLVILKRQA